MIRTLLSIGIIVFLLCPLFSQTPTSIAWGPKLEKKEPILNIVGSDQSHFYTISGPNDKPIFMKFDLSGKLVSEKPINLDVDGAKEMKFFYVLNTADHDYVIFLNRDKKLNKSTFYSAKLKDGNLTPLTKSFHTFPFSYTYGSGLGPAVAYDEEAVSGSFRVSPDKKTIVTFGSDIGHTADQLIEVVVFNEKLEQAWKKTHTVKVPNRQMEILELAVNNSGEVFVVAKRWEKLNDRYMGDKPLDYILYSFTAGGVKEYELKLDQERYPVSVTLTTDAKGQVGVMGTYRTLSVESDYTLGTFFAHISSDKVVAKTFPYTTAALTDLNYLKEELKEKSLEEVAIQTVGVLPNGDFYFTALKYRYSSTSSTGTIYSNTVVGQMLVSFPSAGGSVRVDYLLQPLYVKSLFEPIWFYSYQKDNGVVFVANYIKASLNDKDYKDAPIYTSECYLEPGKPKQCKDISSDTERENLVCPAYQVQLKDGRHVIMRAKGDQGTSYSFGIY